MHITIFGVGRSGTKAVQLYLSYLMAQREKEVWINYEPYFWMDRFTKQINFEGYYQHSHSPHIIRSQQDLTKGHLNFLKKLSVPGKNATTKFIRGNGRMNAINQVIQPDHSIVIIRDLYQVLVSVLKTEWDFWSVGFQFTQSWESFVAEIRKSKIIDNFDWCLDQISDRLDQNAFYWYAMNKAVLQSRWADAYYINYANINRVEEIARILIDPNVKENINDMLFTGDYIHENFPLQSVSRSTTLSDKFNNLLYQTKFMNKYNLHIPYSHYGSMAHLNMDYQKIDSGKEKPTSVKIERKELFDFFNEDILSMLKKIEWKNEVNYEFMDSDIVIAK